jgi:hypothetical protein
MYTKTTFEEELQHNGNIVYTSMGCSMLPLIRQRRDIVEIVAKPEEARCKKYDVVLYKRGDKYILHRVLKVTPKGYIIAGDHNYRREYDITDNQILGTLTAIARDGKRISVTDRKYLAYVHLWCDFFYARAFILIIKGIIRNIK